MACSAQASLWLGAQVKPDANNTLVSDLCFNNIIINSHSRLKNRGCKLFVSFDLFVLNSGVTREIASFVFEVSIIFFYFFLNKEEADSIVLCFLGM